MKRILLLLAGALCSASMYAQTHDFEFVEASSLTLVGKLMKDTPNPYHRVDTVKYKGFTRSENFQVRMSSGISVAFRTTSRSLSVLTEYGQTSFPTNTPGIAARGYDLFIKEGNTWKYASSAVNPDKNLDKNLVLVTDLPEGMKECLLYFPLFSEERSIKIGYDKGSILEASASPFRHRIGIWGSSYTHGTSTSRSGMTYPAQLSRSTGLEFLSLGCSGNCKLQDYFADVLVDADVEAFVFDTFSNPDAKTINERLFPFIEKMQKAHPGKPLIFQSTIYREYRNFNGSKDAFEKEKAAMADSLMSIAVKKYKDVYWIKPCATSADHDTSLDGIHPDAHGYGLWAESVRKQIVRILKRYGIRADR